MDVRGPIDGEANGNLSHLRNESVRHESHSLNGPKVSSATSRAPESEISQLVERLKSVPEVREELVAQTISKLRSGELLTRESAERTAKAIFDTSAD